MFRNYALGFKSTKIEIELNILNRHIAEIWFKIVVCFKLWNENDGAGAKIVFYLFIHDGAQTNRI